MGGLRNTQATADDGYMGRRRDDDYPGLVGLLDPETERPTGCRAAAVVKVKFIHKDLTYDERAPRHALRNRG